MAHPRLTIGLPVRNGERYLAKAIDALLGQDYEDFELVISDNASTDGTEEICRSYERAESRVRVLRQVRNLGLAANHNVVVAEARGELFKWASHDDLYGATLLGRCVAALDENPAAVLAHSWTAMIDDEGLVTEATPYGLATASPRAPTRFRSMLFDDGGDDIYGVVRTNVLRQVLPERSHHHADRTIVTELALHGPFFQVPEWLYFRRDHPGRIDNACPTMRARCANMDPRRANRLRHPAVRLYGEYVWSYVRAIRRAPLTPSERRECFGHLWAWFASRTRPGPHLDARAVGARGHDVATSARTGARAGDAPRGEPVVSHGRAT